MGRFVKFLEDYQKRAHLVRCFVKFVEEYRFVKFVEEYQKRTHNAVDEGLVLRVSERPLRLDTPIHTGGG